MGKMLVSFYEYMMHYPHQVPARSALAAEMKKLSRSDKYVKKIDSLADLMVFSRKLKDPRAVDAVTGDLWCEYCAASGHEMN